MGPIDFHVGNKTYFVNGAHQLLTYILIYICVQQKKFIKVWNNFWVNYPFKAVAP